MLSLRTSSSSSPSSSSSSTSRSPSLGVSQEGKATKGELAQVSQGVFHKFPRVACPPFPISIWRSRAGAYTRLPASFWDHPLAITWRQGWKEGDARQWKSRRSKERISCQLCVGGHRSLGCCLVRTLDSGTRGSGEDRSGWWNRPCYFFRSTFSAQRADQGTHIPAAQGCSSSPGGYGSPEQNQSAAATSTGWDRAASERGGASHPFSTGGYQSRPPPLPRSRRFTSDCAD